MTGHKSQTKRSQSSTRALSPEPRAFRAAVLRAEPAAPLAVYCNSLSHSQNPMSKRFKRLILWPMEGELRLAAQSQMVRSEPSRWGLGWTAPAWSAHLQSSHQVPQKQHRPRFTSCYTALFAEALRGQLGQKGEKGQAVLCDSCGPGPA